MARLECDLQQAYITAGKLEAEVEGARAREEEVKMEVGVLHGRNAGLRKEVSRMRGLGGGGSSGRGGGAVAARGTPGRRESERGTRREGEGRGTPGSGSPPGSARRVLMSASEWGHTQGGLHTPPVGTGKARAGGYVEREREREGAMRELDDLQGTIGELESRISHVLTSSR